MAALYEWIGRLLDGDGIAPDLKEGERLLRQLADLGQLMAMRLLGERLYEGWRLKENRQEGYTGYNELRMSVISKQKLICYV